METNEPDAGYWGRLWGALLGRRPDAPADTPPPPEAPPPPDVADASQLRARIATLEMDVRERDGRIEAMRGEYDALKATGERKAGAAGREELELLSKRLAGPMSNMAVLAALSESGREVAVQDFLKLYRSLEKELGKAGMERLGNVGETVGFDPVIHQRMSGGTVRSGMEVRVRVPGYRSGEKVLMKTMVTAAEEEPHG